jgi:hypothetical protein
MKQPDVYYNLLWKLMKFVQNVSDMAHILFAVCNKMKGEPTMSLRVILWIWPKWYVKSPCLLSQWEVTSFCVKHINVQLSPLNIQFITVSCCSEQIEMPLKYAHVSVSNICSEVENWYIKKKATSFEGSSPLFAFHGLCFLVEVWQTYILHYLTYLIKIFKNK